MHFAKCGWFFSYETTNLESADKQFSEINADEKFQSSVQLVVVDFGEVKNNPC